MERFSLEIIMDWVLEWLVSGNLHVEMLSSHFQFTSPFWKTSSKDHFIVLQYHTKNGHSVYETVLGTVEQGLLTELRSIYDLSETKKALQIS